MGSCTIIKFHNIEVSHIDQQKIKKKIFRIFGTFGALYVYKAKENMKCDPDF